MFFCVFLACKRTKRREMECVRQQPGILIEAKLNCLHIFHIASSH